MSLPILLTKLFTPQKQREFVSRSDLIERLNNGLARKLTLISASAGFGKTTLASEWVAKSGRSTAWLSLDDGDNNPVQFLTYLIAAIQTILSDFGIGVLGALQSPQPPPIESILTLLLNEITTVSDNIILILDDYHLINAKAVDNLLIFLLEHLPPQMHLVILTREDPLLPLARLRSQGQLTELRDSDLRFSHKEVLEFLNQVMGLDLSLEDVSALEARTEGWIAGLQLAALALQGTATVESSQTTTNFIQSFTGSHHFVLDYLLEEVLHQQPKEIQTFLLETSILDRMCGELCETICAEENRASPFSGKETLEYLRQSNLFIVPLDNERRWYRYHHLFADLLKQRLEQHIIEKNKEDAADLSLYHSRASRWFEENGLDTEAFQHAILGNDIDRAARLVEGDWMPLHFRGAVSPVLNWLSSLSRSILDARPSLWVMYASTLSMTGQINGVEKKLQLAEAAISKKKIAEDDLDSKDKNTIGHIAAMRALLAAARYQVDAIISESERALEFLHPDNLAVRTATIWKMGIAYHLQGKRAAAIESYSQAIERGEQSKNKIIQVSGMMGLAQVLETENQLIKAAKIFRQAIHLVGDFPQPTISDAYLGLARIHYQWNDLDMAKEYGEQSVQLTKQIGYMDRYVVSQNLMTTINIGEGNLSKAANILAEIVPILDENSLLYRIPEVISNQVLAFLHQGNLGRAAELAKKHQLPISQARVHMAHEDFPSAISILDAYIQQMEAKVWKNEKLNAMALLSVAFYLNDESEKALQNLEDVFLQTEREGFIRLFVDEGLSMAELLGEFWKRNPALDYVQKVLDAFGGLGRKKTEAQQLVDPLSERELEVLALLQTEMSGPEIAEKLVVSLNTMRTHTKKIYSKLGVNNRRSAVRRAQELNLL